MGGNRNRRRIREEKRRGPREAVVLAECVSCGHQQEIRAGDVATGDHPVCEKCLSPLVAKSASMLAS